jgi:DNA mismatch endonuclease (patch repair protein)
MPKANAAFWERKLARNRQRDAETDQLLRAHGWEVLRIWEHESPAEAANRVENLVRSRLSGATRS